MPIRASVPTVRRARPTTPTPSGRGNRGRRSSSSAARRRGSTLELRHRSHAPRPADWTDQGCRARRAVASRPQPVLRPVVHRTFRGEHQQPFTVYASLTNIGQGVAESTRQWASTEDASPKPSCRPQARTIDSADSGDSDAGIPVRGRTHGKGRGDLPEDGGWGRERHIHFSVGVGDRGVPLSPDTLVLPPAAGRFQGGRRCRNARPRSGMECRQRSRRARFPRVMREPA